MRAESSAGVGLSDTVSSALVSLDVDGDGGVPDEAVRSILRRPNLEDLASERGDSPASRRASAGCGAAREGRSPVSVSTMNASSAVTRKGDWRVEPVAPARSPPSDCGSGTTTPASLPLRRGDSLDRARVLPRAVGSDRDCDPGPPSGGRFPPPVSPRLSGSSIEAAGAPGLSVRLPNILIFVVPLWRLRARCANLQFYPGFGPYRIAGHPYDRIKLGGLNSLPAAEKLAKRAYGRGFGGVSGKIADSRRTIVMWSGGRESVKIPTIGPGVGERMEKPGC